MTKQELIEWMEDKVSMYRGAQRAFVEMAASCGSSAAEFRQAFYKGEIEKASAIIEILKGESCDK